VPEKIRSKMQSFGLPRDEFAKTGGWPHQIYVREARRLIGEVVMTEHHCRGREKAAHSVGLAAYNMDSHNAQRYVTQDGQTRNEGNIEVPVRPYPISYQSIIPKEKECANLLVPIALSSSHIAFGSIRMEPVFMILGQSGATAAMIAIQEGKSLQTIDYAKLRVRLLADRQVLEHESSRPLPN